MHFYQLLVAACILASFLATHFVKRMKELNMEEGAVYITYKRDTKKKEYENIDKKWGAGRQLQESNPQYCA